MELSDTLAIIGTVVGAVIVVITYFNKKEKDRLQELGIQKDQDKKQDQDIALLKQRIDAIESNTKELKSEILNKVDKIDTKVDDLKQMILEVLTGKNRDY